MRRATSLLIVAGLMVSASWLAAQNADRNAEPAKQRKSGSVDQGRYLVHDVAKCIVCHTPKTKNGEIIYRELLRGAAIPVASPYPNQQWAFEAPQIAGLPGFSDDAVITLLMTGRRPDGRAPRPPMPDFHMTRDDAAAVVAYLKSL